MRHTALIGDVKKSRELENWPEIFRILKKTLNQVNRRFAEDVLVKFHPTVGDEFQGTLKTPDKAFDVYTFIKASLPVHVRFGMGIGEVEKLGAGEKGLRGTAFYRAREALEKCKLDKGLLRVKSGEVESLQDQVTNAMLKLTEIIETGWTDRQREIVNFHRLNGYPPHQQIAAHFKIARATATQILSATRLESLIMAEETLKEFLRFGSSSK